MGVISTQAFAFKLIANGIQLDLFKEEDILVSNNVTGLFDIGVLPSEFTRQIQLPGTKKNNAFFDNVYDISITNPYLFSTNTKVPCYLDFDGIYVANGYMQLNKINLVANKFIDSYEVTIYGTNSSFARDINVNYLTDLKSLAKYNHTASFSNVTSSWDGGLFNGDIVYPMADYGQIWEYTQGDIYFGLDDYDSGINVQDYKPAIRAKAVLDAIFAENGYTYKSDFLSQDWFQDVYMVCNRQLKYPVFTNVDLENYGVVKVGPISGSGTTDVNVPINSSIRFPWANVLQDDSLAIGNNVSYNLPVTSSLRGELNLNFNVSCSINNPPQNMYLQYWPTSSYAGGPGSGTTILVNFNDYFKQFKESRTGGLNQTFELATKFVTNVLQPGSYYFGLNVTDWGSSPSPTITLDPKGTTKSFWQITKVNYAGDGRIIDIPLNMPYGTTGIKQIDFILGLQKKFNLVIYPDKTKLNQFIIETFNDWYKRGQIKDFNKYINLDKPISATPANNLAVNQLSFADTLDTDYISQQFYKGANREYGKTYYIDTNNFFSQGKFEVKTTFGNGELLKIPGTGLSGSVGGITPPPATCAIYSIGPAPYSGWAYWTNCDGTAGSKFIDIGTTYVPGCVKIGTISGQPATYITACKF
jgi:hypothetical protein